MVRLTEIMMKWTPLWFKLQTSSSARYMRKHNLYRMTQQFYGRNRNTYKSATKKLYKQIEYENTDRKTRRVNLRDIFSQRILSACKEHDYPYHVFISVLPQMGIELDRHSLSNLAIWEPRTFKSLIELAKEYEYLNQPNALVDVQKPVSVISRGMLKEI